MAWLAAVTIAAPTAHSGQDADTSGRGAYNGWDETARASSYSDFGKAWHHGRGSKRGSCDLKNAVMPTGKSTSTTLNKHILLTTDPSTHPPSATNSRPHPRPRRHRPRLPKLHLRPHQQHLCPRRRRCCRNSLQRLLPRSRHAGPPRQNLPHSSRPAPPNQRRSILLLQLLPILPRDVRPPLLHRRQNAVLRPRHVRARLRQRSFQKGRFDSRA
jgi:hypothetical protein